MNLIYADTSALVGAYLADEPGHRELQAQLLEGSASVVTSEVARVEFASAVMAAARARRVRRPALILDRFDADAGADGPLVLLRLYPESTLDLAYRFIREYSLHSLDAIHLAVASTDAVELAAGGTVGLVTRDAAQLDAARAIGLPTA